MEDVCKNAQSDMVVTVINSHREYIESLLRKMYADDISPADIERTKCDNRCAIGRWLENIASRHQSSAAFERARHAHSDFHQRASELITQEIDGDKDGAIADLSLIFITNCGGFNEVAESLSRLIETINFEEFGLFKDIVAEGHF